MLTGKEKTTSELATSYMEPETLLAMEHNIFTPGNYFYNGVGHVTVKYGEVLAIGFSESRQKHRQSLISCVWQMEIIKRVPFSGGSDDQL